MKFLYSARHNAFEMADAPHAALEASASAASSSMDALAGSSSASDFPPVEEAESAAGTSAPAAAAGRGSGRGRGGGRGRGNICGRKFQRELRAMMFGFGDDPHPLPQTTALAEDLVVDYLERVLHQAAGAAAERSRHVRRGAEVPRVKERDLLFVLRKDKRRLQRAQELLEVYEEQKEARKDYAKDHEEYAREEA